jgi:hypothetical protein
MVGDGSGLLVTSVGSTHDPFRLSGVLVAPQMVYNLLSIRQFTADNSCSVGHFWSFYEGFGYRASTHPM